jgi:predicted hydrocarbon binding protein
MGYADRAPSDEHLACTMTAGIIRRVRSLRGDTALPELLDAAGSPHTLEYLENICNWVSRDEVVALFEAAERVTGDDQFARHVGEEAVRQYAGTQVATVLRAMGSIEGILRQISAVTGKFTVVSEMDVVEAHPGHALLRRSVCEGFEPHRALCDWALGLLSAAPKLYAAPSATVEELQCQVRGDEHCLISVSWDDTIAARTANAAEHITALEAQLAALTESSEQAYAAAGDLIADDDLPSVLTKITQRLASAVGARRYLLVVRPEPMAEPQLYHRGLSDAEAKELAEQVLSADPNDVDPRWLLADISSQLRHYGRIAALFDAHHVFLPHEHQTLLHYARFAAGALDRSTALAESRRGHAETRVLLDFARAIVGASTDEIAERLAEAVPQLVDCDRVTVWLLDEKTARLTCAATYGLPPEIDEQVRGLDVVRGETDPEFGNQLYDVDDPKMLFYTPDSNPPAFVQEMLRRFGSSAIAYVPIIVRSTVLGSITVSVGSRPARLSEARELEDRLAGIVAQAGMALESNGLIDRIAERTGS